MKIIQNLAGYDTLFAPFGGTSEGIKNLLTTINTVPSDQPSTILILGEPGTEKKLVAKLIHAGNKKNNDRLIIFNCFLLTSHSIKNELVAHLKQPVSKKDQVSPATTLLLHKINKLKPSVQSQLSNLIQIISEEYRLKNNMLHIMATVDYHSGQPAANAGICKELDSCFHGCRISIPSLKERKADIPLLLETLSNYYCRKYDQKRIKFSAGGTAILAEYPWQRNTRELKTLVKHLALNHGGKNIGTKELPIHFRNHAAHKQPWSNLHTEINWDSAPIDLKQLVDQLETELIVTAMRRSGGNKMEAARLLNLKRTTLIEKIKKKEISHLWG